MLLLLHDGGVQFLLLKARGKIYYFNYFFAYILLTQKAGANGPCKAPPVKKQTNENKKDIVNII